MLGNYQSITRAPSSDILDCGIAYMLWWQSRKTTKTKNKCKENKTELRKRCIKGMGIQGTILYCKAILGRGQPGRLKWNLGKNMPQMQDRSLHVLICKKRSTTVLRLARRWCKIITNECFRPSVCSARLYWAGDNLGEWDKVIRLLQHKINEFYLHTGELHWTGETEK